MTNAIMSNTDFEVLLSRETIAHRVRELGLKIRNDFEGKELCIIPVMDGGMVFAADLIRGIDLPLTIAPFKASSYGNATTSSGTVEMAWKVPEGIKGKHLLVVDDILDTGKTLKALKTSFMEAGALSVITCVLLRKKASSQLPADYIGFEIPDKFVIGYGLDLAGLYRNLPDIHAVSGE